MKNNKTNEIRFFAFLLTVHFFPLLVYAQMNNEKARAVETLKTRGEVIIRFIRPQSVSIDELTRNLSIDNKKGDTITAYASEKQFIWFTGKQIPFDVLTPRFVANPARSHEKSKASPWDAYPSYREYLQMMESYAANYPDQCMLQEFGTTVNGRKLLAVKISDNPLTDEAEPVFLYTSTIHGDEGTGFMLMLRLIDSLLTSYPTSEEVKELVDNTEIWINPLFNPDGFYFASDSLYFNSTRFNANYSDLNRNFPDPLAGDHPDAMEWQPETIAMMDFMKQHPIVLAANLHDGAELVNYPWDDRTIRHADDSWYIQLARQFADTVHYYSPEGFFTDEDNGITNGSDWYIVYGGRQDYVNYFLHGREVTIELSHVKSPDPSELTTLWNYYKKSLIGTIQQIHPGIHGTITNADSGAPLRAMIEIPGHDRDSSQVFSSAKTGKFYRLLPAGNYTFTVTSPGYISQNIKFSLTANETKEMTINLLPSDRESFCYPIPFDHTLNFLFSDNSKNDLRLTLTDMAGRIIRDETLNDVEGYASLTQLNGLAKGIYLVKIQLGSLVWEMKVVK
jgi:Zinc carboxypeptidase/Carboxypeptidase regulatory-like domain/Secretion system C-terminal sorting domain